MVNRKNLLVSLLAAVAIPAQAAYVMADVEAGVTQCGFYLDGATSPALVSITPPATTCRYNVGTVTVGTHTITADARKPDPVWGLITSPKSAPFSFTRPGPTGNAPTNLVLVP